MFEEVTSSPCSMKSNVPLIKKNYPSAKTYPTRIHQPISLTPIRITFCSACDINVNCGDCIISGHPITWRRKITEVFWPVAGITHQFLVARPPLIVCTVIITAHNNPLKETRIVIKWSLQISRTGTRPFTSVYTVHKSIGGRLTS